MKTTGSLFLLPEQMKKHSLFLILCLFSMGNFYGQNADINLLKNININRNRNMDNTFKVFSNSIIPVSITLPASIITTGAIKQDSALIRKGIYMGTSVLITYGITYALKYSFNRTRPYDAYPFIDNVVHENSSSFPSGHSSNAFANATALSLAFPKWYVIVPAYMWAGTVAYSRLDLGAHYPSDVLAGCIIGCGTAYLSHKLNCWLAKKH